MLTKPTEPDPIEYLIYRKHPIFYTLKVSIQHNAPIPEEWKEEVAQINSYRAELQAKPAAEILNLYNQAKEDEERKRLAYEEEKRLTEINRKKKEQEELVKAISAPADFSYWARMSLWSLAEALALSFGVSPDFMSQRDIRSYDGGIEFVGKFRKLGELVKRAVAARQLTDPVRPTKYLNWVKQHDIAFPEELEEKINRLHGEPIDWKAKYDALSEAYAELKNEKETPKSLDPPKPLRTKERETLLKLIIGMAVNEYGYDPSAAKSPIPKEICDVLAERGISLDVDTIRNKLKEAADLLPPDTKERKTEIG